MTTTSPQAGTPELSGNRATFSRITRILAMVTGTLVVIQFALAGYGAFDGLNHHKGFGAHQLLGNIIGVFTLLVLIAAAIGRPNRRTVYQAATLFVLAGPVQPILAGIGEDHPWVGGIHAFVGLLILGACVGLSMRVRRS
jgi:hypothetical protein